MTAKSVTIIQNEEGAYSVSYDSGTARGEYPAISIGDAVSRASSLFAGWNNPSASILAQVNAEHEQHMEAMLSNAEPHTGLGDGEETQEPVIDGQFAEVGEETKAEVTA